VLPISYLDILDQSHTSSSKNSLTMDDETIDWSLLKVVI